MVILKRLTYVWKGEDFDLVYHLTKQPSRIQPSFEDPTETFRVNVKGSASRL